MTDLSQLVDIDCDTPRQASVTPVLDPSTCCNETCQTVTITGTWLWQVVPGVPNTEMSRTPSIIFMTTGGISYWIDLLASRLDDGSDCSDSLAVHGPYQFNNPDCWWDASSDSVYPDCLLIEDGDTYELKASWCPDCATGITVTFGLVGGPVQRSMTTENSCVPLEVAISFDVEAAGVMLDTHCEEYGPITNLETFDMACGPLVPAGQMIPWVLSCI